MTDVTRVVRRTPVRLALDDAAAAGTFNVVATASGQSVSRDLPVPWHRMVAADVVVADQHCQLSVALLRRVKPREHRVVRVNIAYKGPGSVDERAAVARQDAQAIQHRMAVPGEAAPRRLFVVVNPFAGRQRGSAVFERHARPVLEAAGCVLTVAHTERPGHATELVRGADLTTYDAVVAVGGDGSVHEVLNGFLTRPDWREAAARVPLGHIPAGSGNGLLVSLHGPDGGNDPALCALAIARGQTQMVDISSVHNNKRRLFSFLNQGYGFIAEAQLGVEHLRWMGPLRYTVGGFINIARDARYAARLSMKVGAVKPEIISGQPAASPTDGASPTTEISVPSPSAKAEEGPAQSDADVQPSTSGSSKTHDPGDNGISLAHGHVGQAVPDDWVIVDADDFITVSVSNTSNATDTVMLTPLAKPADGYLDIVFMRGRSSLGQMLGMFPKLKTGDHVQAAYVEYYHVIAYRLEPRTKNVHAYVDGENFECEPFQVEVHPRLVRFFSPTNDDLYVKTRTLTGSPPTATVAKL